MDAGKAGVILDYLDALAYPVVIVLLVGGFLLLFRPQIAQFILNLREAKFPGGSVSAEPRPQETSDIQSLLGRIEDLAVEHARASEDLVVVSNEYLRQREELASTQRDLYFERVYRVIYGSQIWILQLAEAAEQQGRQPPGLFRWEVEGAYWPHRQWDPAGVGLQPWLDFLVDSALVVVEGDRYRITELAREFLLYTYRLGLPGKPL